MKNEYIAHLIQSAAIAVIAILLAVTMIAVWRIDNRIVGISPEGFHRIDAVELMEALCLMNDVLRCPDPYALPGYVYGEF